ncbi:MAG: cysteine--tRNA ligase, partial [Candidatus Nanohaloarchaea archaeon]
ELFQVLGVGVRPHVPVGEREMADLLLDIREDYRADEEYGVADRIRSVLEDAGYAVEDTDDGAVWLKK